MDFGQSSLLEGFLRRSDIIVLLLPVDCCGDFRSVLLKLMKRHLTTSDAGIICNFGVLKTDFYREIRLVSVEVHFKKALTLLLMLEYYI